jgi:hypothetical protein
MKLSLRIIIFAIVQITLALVLISCKGDEAPKQSTTEQSPEEAKQMEAHQKSLEESKRIVVARVNGQPVSMYDLIDEMNVVAPQYIKPGQKKDPKVDDRVKKEALDRLIYRELAVQEAGRQGLQAPPSAVEEELKKFKSALKTEDAYRQRLAYAGITEEEVRRQFEKSILLNMITEKEIFGKVKVDQKLVKRTYEKDKASYKGPSGQAMSFEEARPLIEEKLMTPLIQKREDEWVAQLKKAAKIEILSTQVPKEIGSTN